MNFGDGVFTMYFKFIFLIDGVRDIDIEKLFSMQYVAVWKTSFAYNNICTKKMFFKSEFFTVYNFVHPSYFLQHIILST